MTRLRRGQSARRGSTPNRTVFLYANMMTEPDKTARRIARQALEAQTGWVIRGFEDEPASARPPEDEYLGWVAKSDLVIWVVGGSIAAGSCREINRALDSDRGLVPLPVASTDASLRSQDASRADSTDSSGRRSVTSATFRAPLIKPSSLRVPKRSSLPPTVASRSRSRSTRRGLRDRSVPISSRHQRPRLPVAGRMRRSRRFQRPPTSPR